MGFSGLCIVLFFTVRINSDIKAIKLVQGTYAVVGYLKRKEQMDVYDPPSALNPLGVFS